MVVSFKTRCIKHFDILAILVGAILQSNLFCILLPHNSINKKKKNNNNSRTLLALVTIRDKEASKVPCKLEKL
jgi:hypothetical protein